MRWFTRPLTPAPQTDMQSRLRYISDECKKIEADPKPENVKELAYYISYIALIIEKHLKTKEV